MIRKTFFLLHFYKTYLRLNKRTTKKESFFTLDFFFLIGVPLYPHFTTALQPFTSHSQHTHAHTTPTHTHAKGHEFGDH